VVLLVVGIVGVLAIGTGYAKGENKDENAAGAKCSEDTLHGRYLFAYDGFVIKGNENIPFASSGYEVYDANGKVKAVFTQNVNGEITRNESISGTYAVKADCTGTATYADGTRFDQFIAPDGSKLTFVQTHPKRFVTASFEPRGTAKRVGE
jgi:hypothetical protein